LALVLSIGAGAVAAPAPARSNLAGTWSVEQIAPGGSSRQQGTLTVTQNGNELAGVLRFQGAEVPLANLRESDGIISFSTRVPDRPAVTLNYSGAVRGNQLGMASQDLGSGSYTLVAQRAGATPAPAQTATAKTAPAETATAKTAPAPAQTAATAKTAPAPAQTATAKTAPAPAPAQTATAKTAPAPAQSPTAKTAPAAQTAKASPASPTPRVIAPAAPRTTPPPVPAPRAAPPTEPDMPTLVGDWKGEHSTPEAGGPTAASLSFTSDGDRIAGILRWAGQDLPLFDVRQSGSALSFTVVVPGTPYETIKYEGTVTDDRVALRGNGDRSGAYQLVATREPQTVAVSAAPPVQPTGSARPAQRNDGAASAAALQGDWVGEVTAAGGASKVTTSLRFQGDVATMRLGGDELPLFDVSQSGQAVAFTVVVPGTPYRSIRYSGVLADDRMLLSSVDDPRGIYTLRARRADQSALPEPQPSGAMTASLQPMPPVLPGAERPVKPEQRAPLMLRDLPPNGLALRPPMGWASRQVLGSRTNATAIRQSVDALVDSGLARVGYTYVEIGDGWQGVRDAGGVLHSNERFADMKALGDDIHAKGLKFGLTVAAGPKSCAGFEGSRGYESQDARRLAEWGVDYVVLEFCGAEGVYPSSEDVQAAAQKMAEALRETGRDIVYVISLPGRQGVERWAANVGANVWRTGTELEDDWRVIAMAGFAQNGTESAARPGAWNDPGLLQVGSQRMIAEDSRIQLSLWAILAAPLMLGSDVRYLSREAVALLSNPEVIAVNQDSLGRQGKRVAQMGDTEVWARPLADGSVAVALFNAGRRSERLTLTWDVLGVEGPQMVRDLWAHSHVGIADGRFGILLGAGSSMLLTFTAIGTFRAG
jgi:hypothetical protein